MAKGDDKRYLNIVKDEISHSVRADVCIKNLKNLTGTKMEQESYLDDLSHEILVTSRMPYTRA